MSEFFGILFAILTIIGSVKFFLILFKRNGKDNEH